MSRPSGYPLATPLVAPAVSSRAPRRVTLLRVRGYRKPPGCVVVKRPGRLGNPFIIGQTVTVDGVTVFVRDNLHAVQLYTDHLARHPELVALARELLRGNDVGCSCAQSEPCHGDVLLRVANADDDRSHPMVLDRARRAHAHARRIA